MNKYVKNLVIRPLKVLGWIIGSLIFLLVLITLSTRIPYVQNLIKDKAVSFYKDKTGTEASLGSLYVNFPSTVEVNELYVEDAAGDTLAYSGEIRINTDLLDLLNNKLSLDDIYVKNLVGNIHNSNSDSTFNYQFIIDAFSSPKTAPPDTATSKPFDFGVYGVEIEQARVTYMDFYNGMELKTDIGYLLADASRFDLTQSQIFVDAIHLNDSEGSFRITKESNSSPDTVSSPFYVNGEQIFVSNVDFTFEDVPGGIRVINQIGTAKIKADSINIVDQVYDAREITLLETKVSVDIFKSSDSTESVKEAEIPEDNSDLALLASSENITMGNVDFRFYDHTKTAAPKGFDPFYMWFQQVSIRASNIVFENGYARGSLDHVEAIENNGLILKELETQFEYGENNSALSGLKLVTSNSQIVADMQVSYEDLAQIENSPGKIGLDLLFPSSFIDLRDIAYFVPSIESSLPASVPDNLKIRWEGGIGGKVNSLTLDRFSLTMLEYTRLFVDGQINGITDINKLSADVSDLQFQTTLAEAEQFIPDSLMPAQINLPDTMQLAGKVSGGINKGTAEFNLETTLGDVIADVALEQVDSIYQYTGNIRTTGLDVGSFISNPDLGPLTAYITFDGEGLKLEDIQTTLDGRLGSFEYLDYSYDTLNLSAILTSRKFEGVLSMDDPNLTFDFNGDIGFSDSVNTYAFDLNIEKADLKNLNLTDSDFQLIAHLTSSISASSVDDINGYLLVKDTYLNKDNQVIPVDSLYFDATASEDSTSYHVFSNFIEADFTGTFKMSQLPDVIRQHVDKYYTLEGRDTVEFTALRPQSFDMNIDIKDPTIFTQLVPNLNGLIVEEITGHYNSEDWEIDLNINIPRLVYGGLEADSLFVGMESDEFELDYKAGANQLMTGPVQIHNILLEGNVESNNIMTALHIQDDENQDKYLFGGIFISLEDHYRFMFTPGKFVTNYNSWDIKPSNSIDFFPGATWVENLFVESGEQEIKIYSEVNDRQDSLLNVDFSGLRLNELGNVTNDSVAIVSGIVHGDMSFNTVSTGLAFTSDIDIEQFSYKGDTLGNIDMQGDTEDGQLYSLNMAVSGEKNQLNLEGQYDADSAGSVDMDMTIRHLDLASVQALTGGQLQDMEGFITGSVAIDGTATRPDIDGDLKFNQAQFRPTYIGSLIKIDGQNLHINNSGISLNGFTMEDEQGDEAVLSGEVTTDNFLVYDLNMEIKTRNFKVINRPLPDGIPRNESPFYGDLDVTSDISLQGTSVQPVIKLSASFGDGSSFAYVIPEETLTEEEQKDVIEWFDQDLETIEFFNADASKKADSVQNALKGIDLNAKITVTPENELSIVIDPLTGDKLSVKGNATLNYDIQTSGQQTLSGRFEVTEGSYVLNFYNLMRREFAIQEGSYILWTGDPLNAIMNVTAVYEVRAAPVGLNNFQGKLDFLVYLDIGGQLVQPEISFRLGLAPDAPAPIQVEAWVNQQNTQAERVNKQVFGLLLFQSFFPDDSYASAGNVNFVENTARSSVSRILSSQLNRLSDQIEGIDLTIDLDSYEDYTDQGDAFGRTELELGVSKQLFNERVVVKLAGNVDLEGNRSQQGVSNFAGDIQIEYKLTEDGRYRLLGFRNNDFDNLQGEIIKTGVGIIYVREYNAFRELFRKSREELALEAEKDRIEAEEESKADNVNEEGGQDK